MANQARIGEGRGALPTPYLQKLFEIDRDTF
jgi:hypothetical protein